MEAGPLQLLTLCTMLVESVTPWQPWQVKVVYVRLVGYTSHAQNSA